MTNFYKTQCNAGTCRLEKALFPGPYVSKIICNGELYKYSGCSNRNCAFNKPFEMLLKDLLVKWRITKAQYLLVVENFEGFVKDYEKKSLEKVREFAEF